MEYSFIAITPGPSLSPSASTCKGPVYDLLNHLTVCKQMTDVKLNGYCYIAVMENV